MKHLAGGWDVNTLYQPLDGSHIHMQHSSMVLTFGIWLESNIHPSGDLSFS